MFRKILVGPLISAGCCLGQSTPSIPTGPWTDIYNKRDLTGWSHAGNPPWSLSGEILTAKGGTLKTMLIWNQPLKDLEIEVTYRLSTAAANGGIQVRSQCKERTDVFPKCGNYQVCGLQLDVAMSHSGKLFEECVGFLVNSGQHVDDCRRTLKVGEWMTTTARFQGSRISLWLNGAHCLDYTLTKVEHLQGTLFALQSHPPFDPIDYRSVRIRDLASTAIGPVFPAFPAVSARAVGSEVRYAVPEGGMHTVRLLRTDGSVVAERQGLGPAADAVLPLPERGFHFLEIRTPRGRTLQRVLGLPW